MAEKSSIESNKDTGLFAGQHVSKNPKKPQSDTSLAGTSMEVRRISSFLAGEIEVPVDIPGWKLLCSSSSESTDSLHSPNSTHSLTKRRRIDLTDSTLQCVTRAAVQKQREVANPKKDVSIPVLWEACLLLLWEHVIKYSYMTQTVCRSDFVNRIKRISNTAAGCLNQRGYFTLKYLMGMPRATKVYHRAHEYWHCRSELSNHIRWYSAPSMEPDAGESSASWFCPEESNFTFKTFIDSPDIRLLFLYIDTIVQATRPGLRNLRGTIPEIKSRSWPAITVQTKSSTGMGVRKASCDKQNTLRDKRFLVVQYFLNPTWKKKWGGHLTLSSLSGRDSTSQKMPHPNTTTILPTLDRLLMFYSDGRTTCRVNPMKESAEVNERYAIYAWYYDNSE